jgi:hypothetical protein
MALELRIGQHLTLLKIDDMMALTHRYELEVRGGVNPPEGEWVGYEKRDHRLAVVRQRGKRKERYLDLRADDILLHGWEMPFKADTEHYGKDGSMMHGNACYNLVGDPDDIKRFLETRALQLSDSAKAKIFVYRRPPTGKDQGDVELLYPDIETQHAVIARFKGRE